ncbi:hypothetical protein EYC59_05680 [Candidatus Saccharibacteria bacterium]|nr:MAG: hypothetical protein EYC59_05680 [Candidatus Saccharibacteria bacterium]
MNILQKQKLRDNASGFGATVVVAIVAAVVVVGLAGYFVYAKNSDSKKSDTTHNTTKQSNATKSSTTATENTLAIKEWGVTVNFQGAEYVKYQMASDGSGADDASLSLKDNFPTSDSCKDLRVGIQRYTTEQPASKYVQHVGSYYYKLHGSPITCDTGDDSNSSPNFIRQYIVDDLTNAKFTVTEN